MRHGRHAGVVSFEDETNGRLSTLRGRVDLVPLTRETHRFRESGMMISRGASPVGLEPLVFEVELVP
jgi:hypothetical protein